MFAAKNLLLTPPAPDVALSFIGAASAQTTTVGIPTHQAGDLIVMFAFRFDTTALATKPSAGGNVPTWTDIDANTGSSSGSARTAYAVGTGSTTSGTWTSANILVAAVLRGQNASPIGGHAETGGNSADPTCTSPSVTLLNSSGSSILLNFYASKYINTWSAAPSGYTRRTAVGSWPNAGGVLNTKDSSTTDGSSGQGSSSFGVSSPWRAAQIEILN